MKLLKSQIKLVNLKTESLSNKGLKHAVGGACSCGCYYSGCGGSSSTDNSGTNKKGGLLSILPAGDNWGYAY